MKKEESNQWKRSSNRWMNLLEKIKIKRKEKEKKIKM